MKPRSAPLRQRPVIGIPLSMYVHVSVDLLKIVLKNSGLSVPIVLRFHPLTPEETVKEAMGQQSWPANIESFSEPKMEDFLNSIDIMVYSHSSACFEAVMIGVPVIFMDTGQGLTGDRMFNNRHLKWHAADAEELAARVTEIGRMDHRTLMHERQLARRYVENYFHPVTPDNLDRFIVE